MVTDPTVPMKLELQNRVGPLVFYFTDMRASWYPKPRFETKFKVRWDDTKLYVGAYVQDKDLWGTVNISDTAGMVIVLALKRRFSLSKQSPKI